MNDEWITVSRGGRHAAPPAKQPAQQPNFRYKASARSKASLDLDRLIDSALSEAWLFASERLKQLPMILTTICYGIGSFAEVKRSRYQLAFLLLINELLKPKSALIFDPVLSDEENTFLHRRGLTPGENDEGNFVASSPTLFFMPHCGRRLYSNLLCTNWGTQLHNVILIGNSFDNFVLRSLPTERTFRYIRLAHAFVSEVALPNDIGAGDALNDTSIHLFSKDRLAAMAAEVWADRTPEPRDPDDREIVYRPTDGCCKH